MLLIDARCLNEPNPTGVTEVARQFITALKNQFPNAPTLTTQQSFSNTLTNCRLALRFATLEKILKQPQNNLQLFLPNINFVHTLPTTRRIQLIHDLSFLHAPQWFNWRSRLWHQAAAAIEQIKTADQLIAVSEWTRQDLINHLNIPAERIVVINPHTPDQLPAQKPALNFSDAPFFLFIGTLEKRKNVAAIIEAFELIKNLPYLKNYQLVLAGKPGFGCPAPQAAAERVHFLSYTTPAEKWWLLQSARALIFPSFFEGFGLPPLEAAAAGCPTIISDCTALPETMGAAALQISPYDVKQIALAMEAMATDNNLHTEIKIRGRERAAWYSKERQTQAINNLFAQLI